MCESSPVDDRLRLLPAGWRESGSYASTRICVTTRAFELPTARTIKSSVFHVERQSPGESAAA